MSQFRSISKKMKKKATLEGAGVKLHRVFGFHSDNSFDPFLLLDDFSSNRYQDYIEGFPWHPHRGIETITYMLKGNVAHQDSLGNKGIIKPGGVQWMTAGSGIIHQEMPEKTSGWLQGFQLWANLPRSHKMMDPRYREIRKKEIPNVSVAKGIQIKIIAGKINGIKGPVKGIKINPEFLDISLDPKSRFQRKIHPEKTVLVYIFEGIVHFSTDKKDPIEAGYLVKLDGGNEIYMETQDQNGRLLLITGLPLQEPIAWRGPIVMNTQEELNQAFRDYRQGSFIKVKKANLKIE